VWLDSGEALFDVLGPDFTLLRIGDNPPDTTALEAAAVAAGVPLKVVSLTDPVVSEVYQAPLVIIRPDLMISWRSHDVPADAASLVDIIRGAQPATSSASQ